MEVDDFRRAREADKDDDDELSQVPYDGTQGADTYVGVTTSLGSYPTVAGKFYAVIPQTVTGTETEGGPGTLTAASSHRFAYNVGRSVPPNGTPVIVDRTKYRDVFQYD